MGKLSAPMPRDRGDALSILEVSRLQVALLALGILILVVQMGVIVWFGVRWNRKQSSIPRAHNRLSHPYLSGKGSINHPGHNSLLGPPAAALSWLEEETPFLDQVRRRSEEIAAAVQQNPVTIRRKVAAHAEAVPRSTMRDGKVASSSGMSWEAGSGKKRAESMWEKPVLGASEWCLRRHSSFLQAGLPVRRVGTLSD